MRPSLTPEAGREVPPAWSAREDVAAQTRPGRLSWLETAVNGRSALEHYAPGAAIRTHVEQRAGESGLNFGSGSIAALLHDTRNMVAAIDLYCDLLEEPGVLAAPFRHYAGELRLVAGASRRLLDSLERMDDASSAPRQVIRAKAADGAVPSPASFDPELSPRAAAETLNQEPWESDFEAEAHIFGVPGALYAMPDSLTRGRRRIDSASEQVTDLADELQALRNLLSALVGPAITVGLTIERGNRPIAMSTDDLTRVMINLAKNAADAMPCGGHIQIALREVATGPETGVLVLTVADNGPGIPDAVLEEIFDPGYTTHISLDLASPDFTSPDFTGPDFAGPEFTSLEVEFEGSQRRIAEPSGRLEPLTSAGQSIPGSDLQNLGTELGQHRGLGLAIVRTLVRAAGGEVSAANRTGRSWPVAGPDFSSEMMEAGEQHPGTGSGTGSDTGSGSGSGTESDPDWRRDWTEDRMFAATGQSSAQGAVFVLQIPWSTGVVPGHAKRSIA